MTDHQPDPSKGPAAVLDESEPPPGYEVQQVWARIDGEAVPTDQWRPKAKLKAGTWDNQAGAVAACWEHCRKVTREQVSAVARAFDTTARALEERTDVMPEGWRALEANGWEDGGPLGYVYGVRWAHSLATGSLADVVYGAVDVSGRLYVRRQARFHHDGIPADAAEHVIAVCNKRINAPAVARAREPVERSPWLDLNSGEHKRMGSNGASAMVWRWGTDAHGRRMLGVNVAMPMDHESTLEDAKRMGDALLDTVAREARVKP